MKLFPLELPNKPILNISKISRKIKINVTVPSGSSESIVIISNGSPDDIVFGILSFHSDGKELVGIVKPPRITRIAVLDIIKTYLLKLKPRIKKMLILMDQEEDNLNDIFDKCKRRLIKNNISITKEEGELRLKVYDCKYVDREFKIILVINGLDEIDVKKHRIEDHLIKAACLFLKDFKPKVNDSKKAWESLGKRQQIDILRMLKEKKKEAHLIFSQHFKGLEYLEMG